MYINIFEYFWTNFLHVEVTDVIVTNLNQWNFFWQMLFAICYIMADVIAIVAYIYATIFVCGRWHRTQ